MLKYNIENINIEFDKNIIYENFSIEFEPGKITSILGRSGCGKTTLLKYIMSDFMKYENLSSVFQENNLIEWLNVHENLDLILKSRISSKEERNKIIDKSLDLVNLREYKKYFPNKLSGGMKQRVNIARAVSYPASFLLMDEPFSSIDIINKTEIIKKLKTEIASQNKTVIMVSHDLDEVLEFSDNIICLGGRPVEKTKIFSGNKCISKEILIKYI